MSHRLCWITQSEQRWFLELYTQNPTHTAVDVGCKSVPTPHAHDVFPPLSFTVSQTRGFPSPPQVSGREHKNRTQLHLLTGEPLFIEKTSYLTVMIHSNWFAKGCVNHSTVRVTLSGRRTVRWVQGDLNHSVHPLNWIQCNFIGWKTF